MPSLRMLALLLPALLLMGSARGQDLPCPDDLDAASVLARLNALREQPRACGAAPMPAAPALRWQALLAASADEHARELAQRDTLSHQGLKTRSLRERLHRAGYRMRLSGENLAAGPASLEEALALWLASPGHCENLMLAEFRDAGLACAAAPGRHERFWVLHLGRGAAE